MTTITQTQAYQLCLKLDREGLPRRKIAKELARQGWVSHKTGKPLTNGAICMIISRMKDPKYKPSDITVKKYAGSATRYRARKPQPTPAVQVIPPKTQETRYAGALLQVEELARKQRQFADALDLLIAAVK